jgi:hypothetical protein
MPKPVRKPDRTPVKSTPARLTSAVSPRRTVGSKSASKDGAISKQARVIAMLQSPGGTSIAAIMQQTGWQQHSVRGFLASVVRKKLKHELQSTKTDGGRIYRVGGGSQSKTADRLARHRSA